MTPRLSVAVQAHPLRDEIAKTVAAAAGADEIVWDDAAEYAFRCPWRGYRLCLEATPAWATHRLIVQDDVVVCQGFRDAAEAALTAQPDRVVLFYVGGSPRPYGDAVRAAGLRDKPWVDLQVGAWCPVVATAWPVRLIQPMLEFVDGQGWPDRFCSDDEIAGRFLRHAGESMLATVPSLVQHPDDVPSLIGDRRNWAGGDPARVAACYIGDCDPACIDWTVAPERGI